MSLIAPLLNFGLRTIEKPALARAEEPVPIRARFERSARLLFHAPLGTRMAWQTLPHSTSDAEVLEVTPKEQTSDVVIFYIHGGGFLFGSPQTHSALAAQLARRLGARAILPRYRRAPEHPFPAAFDDVRRAWDALIQSGMVPERIVLGGDSAGGALALSLLASLIAEKAALPGATFCFSPLTDLTFSGESMRTNAKSEAILPAARASEMAGMYLDGHPPDDPKVSPLFADFTDACPVYITVGNTEILLDDARRMVARLKENGVATTYVEQGDLPHVWQLFHNVLPEARASLDEVSDWIRAQLRSPVES